MTFVYKSHGAYEPQPNPKRCAAAVGDGTGGVYQCPRKGVVSEGANLWCKQHSPSAEKQKRQKLKDKYAAKRRAENYQAKLKYAAREIVDIAVKWHRNEATHIELCDAVDAYNKLNRP